MTGLTPTTHKKAALIALIQLQRKIPGTNYRYAIAHIPIEGGKVKLSTSSTTDLKYGKDFEILLSANEYTDSYSHKNRYNVNIEFPKLSNSTDGSEASANKELNIQIKFLALHLGSFSKGRFYASPQGMLSFKRKSTCSAWGPTPVSPAPPGPAPCLGTNYQYSQTKGFETELPGGTTPRWSVSTTDPDDRRFPNLYEFAVPGTTDIDRVCANQTLNKPDSQSFGKTSWGFSFSNVSYKSWNFANEGSAATVPPAPGAVVGTLTFGASDIAPLKKTFENGNRNIQITGPAKNKFKVISIAEKCVVKKEANLVLGFFTCKEFIVEKRESPLRIIGTIIVINKLHIDPTALTQGIKWSSIYEPDVTNELRKANILTVPLPPGTNNGDFVEIKNPTKGWDIVKVILGESGNNVPQYTNKCNFYILSVFNRFMTFGYGNRTPFKDCAVNKKVFTRDEANEFVDTCWGSLYNLNYLSSTHPSYSKLVTCYKDIVAKRPPPYIPEEFKCDESPALPAWFKPTNPNNTLAVKENEKRYYCNVGSLRALADPFQWTAVDPDCGVITIGATTTATTMCKKEMRNFFVIEHTRTGGF